MLTKQIFSSTIDARDCSFITDEKQLYSIMRSLSHKNSIEFQCQCAHICDDKTNPMLIVKNRVSAYYLKTDISNYAQFQGQHVLIRIDMSIENSITIFRSCSMAVIIVKRAILRNIRKSY